MAANGKCNLTIADTPDRPLEFFFPQSLDTLPPLQDRIELFIDPVATVIGNGSSRSSNNNNDTSASTSSAAFTTFKTSNREHYDAARARAHIPSYAAPAEVLLHDAQGLLIEGSLTSVYVHVRSRGDQDGDDDGNGTGRWLTPRAASGANLGTTRRWALERGLCVEGDVAVEEIRGGSGCAWISNGLKGFMYGHVADGTFEPDGADVR